jgi:hypothetical protein
MGVVSTATRAATPTALPTAAGTGTSVTPPPCSNVARVPQRSLTPPRVRLPTWARWVLPFGVAAALVVGLVVWVDGHNGNGLATQSPAAAARANREAEILVAQDQAPHVVRLRSSADPLTAFRDAVRADMTQRINRGFIDGTLRRITCRRRGGTSRAMDFSCAVIVDGINYPYVGVVHVAAHQLIYCKRDEPPVPSQNIPLSPRCSD